MSGKQLDDYVKQLKSVSRKAPTDIRLEIERYIKYVKANEAQSQTRLRILLRYLKARNIRVSRFKYDYD